LDSLSSPPPCMSGASKSISQHVQGLERPVLLRPSRGASALAQRVKWRAAGDVSHTLCAPLRQYGAAVVTLILTSIDVDALRLEGRRWARERSRPFGDDHVFSKNSRNKR
jgi:hypothetical protein